MEDGTCRCLRVTGLSRNDGGCRQLGETGSGFRKELRHVKLRDEASLRRSGAVNTYLCAAVYVEFMLPL